MKWLACPKSPQTILWLFWCYLLIIFKVSSTESMKYNIWDLVLNTSVASVIELDWDQTERLWHRQPPVCSVHPLDFPFNSKRPELQISTDNKSLHFLDSLVARNTCEAASEPARWELERCLSFWVISPKLKPFAIHDSLHPSCCLGSADGSNEQPWEHWECQCGLPGRNR